MRKWYKIAVKLAETARADEYFVKRNLYPNVDYYSAIVLYTLDLDVDMFTPLFAMSRIAGWSAHVIAQMGGRLIRPESELCWSARLQVGSARRTLGHWLPRDARARANAGAFSFRVSVCFPP